MQTTLIIGAATTLLLSTITGLIYGARLGAVSLILIPCIISALFLLESFIGFQGILVLTAFVLIFGAKYGFEDEESL